MTKSEQQIGREISELYNQGGLVAAAPKILESALNWYEKQKEWQ